jgi:hypothetical protein
MSAAGEEGLVECAISAAPAVESSERHRPARVPHLERAADVEGGELDHERAEHPGTRTRDLRVRAEARAFAVQHQLAERRRDVFVLRGFDAQRGARPRHRVVQCLLPLGRAPNGDPSRVNLQPGTRPHTRPFSFGSLSAHFNILVSVCKRRKATEQAGVKETLTLTNKKVRVLWGLACHSAVSPCFPHGGWLAEHAALSTSACCAHSERPTRPTM